MEKVCNSKLVLSILVLCGLLGVALSEMSLLGLGGGGGAVVKGSSFQLDTKSRMTRVHGRGITVDLEVLEIMTCGGSLKYSPSQIEFHKGAMRWITTMSEGQISINHNEKTVLQLGAPDASNYYQLGFSGDASFRDVLLDHSLGIQAMSDLCLILNEIDKLITLTAGLQTTSSTGGPGDNAAPKQPVSEQSAKLECSRSVKTQHYSVQQTLDLISRNLLKLAHETASTTSALKKKTDSALKIEMFTNLKNDLETFRIDLGKNFKASETQLKQTVSDSVASLVSQVDGLAANISSSVSALQAETREMLQVECIQFVNASIENIVVRTDSSLEELRQAMLTSLKLLDRAVKNIEETTLPSAIEDVVGKVRQLDDRATFSNEKINALQLQVAQNMSTLMESISETIEASKTDLHAHLENLNISVLLLFESQKESLNTTLTAVSTKINDELSVLRSADKEMVSRISSAIEVINSNISDSFKSHREDISLLSAKLQLMDGAIKQNITSSIFLLTEALQGSMNSVETNFSHLNSSFLENLRTFNSSIFEQLHSDKLGSLLALSSLRDEISFNSTKIAAETDLKTNMLNESMALALDAISKDLSLSETQRRYEFIAMNVSIAKSIRELNDSIANVTSQAANDALFTKQRIDDASKKFNISITEATAHMRNALDQVNTSVIVLRKVFQDSMKNTSDILADKISRVETAATLGLLLYQNETRDAMELVNRSIISINASCNSNRIEFRTALREADNATSQKIDNLSQKLSSEIQIVEDLAVNGTAMLAESLTAKFEAYRDRTNQSIEGLKDQVLKNFSTLQNVFNGSLVGTATILQESLQTLNKTTLLELKLIGETIEYNKVLSSAQDRVLSDALNLTVDALNRTIQLTESRVNHSLKSGVDNITAGLSALHAVSALNFSDVLERIRLSDLKERAQFNQTIENLEMLRAGTALNISSLNHTFQDELGAIRNFTKVTEGELRLMVQVFNLTLSSRADDVMKQLGIVNSTYSNAFSTSNDTIRSIEIRLGESVSALNRTHLDLASHVNASILNHTGCISIINSELVTQQKATAMLEANLTSLLESNSLLSQQLKDLSSNHNDLDMLSRSSILMLNTTLGSLSRNQTATEVEMRRDCASNYTVLANLIETKIDALERDHILFLKSENENRKLAFEDTRSRLMSTEQRLEELRNNYISTELKALKVDLKDFIQLSISDVNKTVILQQLENRNDHLVLKQDLYLHVQSSIRNATSAVSTDLGAIRDGKLPLFDQRLLLTEMRIEDLNATLSVTKEDLSNQKKLTSSTSVRVDSIWEIVHSNISADLKSLNFMTSSSDKAIQSMSKRSDDFQTAISSRVDSLVGTFFEMNNRTSSRIDTVVGAVRSELSNSLITIETKHSLQIADTSKKLSNLEHGFNTSLSEYRRELSDGIQILDRRLSSATSSQELALQSLNDKLANELNTVTINIVEAQELIRALTTRIISAEAIITQQQQAITYLQNKLDAQVRDSASMASIDTLRREFQQLQGAMMEHSGKVLDLLTANMAKR